MSNRLITDTFPKVKKQRITKKNVKITDVKQQKVTDLSPNVKQEKDLQLLKEFDMNMEYGACIGITRMERWERAQKFGLNPPETIKDLISQHLNNETYTECIWSKEKL